MALATVEPTDSLSSVLSRNSFILGELASHPLAAVYSPQFDAFQGDWFVTFSARTLLEIAVDKARGAEEGADDALDDFVDIFDRTLLIAVKNDREAGVYLMFFGNKPAHLLKRPILADELATCKSWIPTLQLPEVPPSVAALAPQLIAVCAAADVAVGQRVAAEQALKAFDTIGGKKTLIDAFNALCKSVHGDLNALPFQKANLSLMLPKNFGDRFFPHQSHGGVTALTNPKDVQKVLDGLKVDTQIAQDHLDSLNAKAELKAAQKKAKEEADALVAIAKKEAADAKQKLKDAEKAAKDAKKNPPPPPAPPAPPTPPTPPGG
jgi:hypothetical protein